MKPLYKILAVVFSLLIVWRIDRFCYDKTDGFQIAKIRSHLPISAEWATPSPTVQDVEDLQQVFSQPFFYLDSGGQCYAFLSQDGKVVLKFFKMHHIRQYPWLHKIPLPGLFDYWKNQFLHFQKRKLERLFLSSQIAYTQLQEETGLLYLNLNPEPKFKDLSLTLIDKIGIEHHISLQNVPFILQHKADNPFDMLRFHLKRQDMTSAKEIVRDIFAYLTARMQKGIIDTDPALRRNIGLLKERAIAIDIGSFVLAKEPMSTEETKQELLKDTRRMHRWLQKRSWELADYLDSLIASMSGGS